MKKSVLHFVCIVIVVVILVVFLYLYTQGRIPYLSPEGLEHAEPVYMIDVERDIEEVEPGVWEVTLHVRQSQDDKSIILEDNLVSDGTIEDVIGFENLDSYKGYSKIDDNKVTAVMLSPFFSASFTYKVLSSSELLFDCTAYVPSLEKEVSC